MRTREHDILNTRAAARAFALVEVLIAIFILAIGMISVATIFPVAIHQSRQATDDIVGQMVGEQALALLRAKGITTVEMDPNGFKKNGNLITPDGIKEGFVLANGVLAFNITGKTEVKGMGMPAASGISPQYTPTFGIPAATAAEQQFIWAYEMVWPALSGFPDPSITPPANRRLAFPEAQRHPQYAWKVFLYKPEPSSPITATIVVYRVSNWEAFWNYDWQNIFPDIAEGGVRINDLDLSALVPGDILIKSGPEPGQKHVGVGTAWRITRTRADPNFPLNTPRDSARKLASMLPDGAIFDPALLDENFQILRLPQTDLGRFRPVAVVTGTID